MTTDPPVGPSDGASWYERIPPPVWFFGCLGAGWGLDKAFPFPIPFPSLGWQLAPALFLFATATGLAVWAMKLFQSLQCGRIHGQNPRGATHGTAFVE